MNSEVTSRPKSAGARASESVGARAGAGLTWLGGGHRAELPEADERSTFAVVGALVALVGILSWLVASAALVQATTWPWPAAGFAAIPIGLLVSAVARAISGGARDSRGLAGRVGVALVVGVVVGELLATVLFSGAVDRRLADAAQADAATAPAVVRAQDELDRARADRVALDTAVTEARTLRDEALITARCEFNPSPECPPAQITGVPGSGPEALTANERLDDAQAELNSAIDARDERAQQLESTITDRDAALTQAHDAAAVQASNGLGDRWAAMNSYTADNPGALVLRLVSIAFMTMLTLLPMLLRRWRGETTQDRHVAARAAQDRAVVAADTAIVQNREQARVAVLSGPSAGPTPVSSERVQPDRALEAGPASAPSTELVPAPSGSSSPALLDSIESVTKAATRWVSPFVPQAVARAIDSTANYPVRMARTVIEEVEEFTVTVKRTSRVTVHTEEVGPSDDQQPIILDEAQHDDVRHAQLQRTEPPTERRSALVEGSPPRTLPRGR
ncbi:DUF4407 domain-containing protein [Aldersonia sp. NBC_00410]|uniref:DUF4407 domain-containing protein n=1 Tax=Aldersonia sp. NBC_00410 TaxID=2975954 RepID=UPI00224DF652|nr:DUF4407 domain-containing protein [Aldersonia sp. NBC_00410]MCX5045073.1 DUF4407 domain-containing protein [Aldersonia sp. NBC_00410]